MAKQKPGLNTMWLKKNSSTVLNLHRHLFKFKYIILASSLIYIFYIIISIHLSVSSYFVMAWSGAKLEVVEILESPFNIPLEVGDFITHVDGRAVHRTRKIFPLVKDSYNLTVLHRNEINTFSVPFPLHKDISILEPDYVLFALVLIFYSTSAIIWVFAPHNDVDAFYVGATFLIFGIGFLSLRAAFEGIPGTWIIGHTFGGLSFLSLTFTSLLFDEERKLIIKYSPIIKIITILVTILASLAVFEVLSLYPSKSFIDIVGVSISNIEIILLFGGWLVHLIILLVRSFSKNTPPYLRRKLATLIFYLGIGTIPVIILVSYTSIRSDTVEIPSLATSAVTAMMMFIPIGYIFTIYRYGYLKLPKQIINVTVFGILFLSITFFYSVGIDIIRRYSKPEDVNNYLLILTTIIIFIVWQIRSPIIKFLDRLIYGAQGLNENIISEFAFNLSVKPDVYTLKQIVDETAKRLRIPQLIIYLMHSQSSIYLTNTDDVVINNVPSSIKAVNLTKRKEIRTNRNRDEVLENIEWAHAKIPLIVREKIVGFLISSNPVDEPFLNHRHLDWLLLIGNIIAVGFETISLFETSLELSGRLLKAREDERENIARKIHDGPLQVVVTVADKLNSKDNVKLSKDAERLRDAGKELRSICQGLHPPVLDCGTIDLVLKEVIHLFKRKQSRIDIEALFDDSFTQASDVVIVAIYYATIEALNNVEKHSSGTKVQVKLEVADKKASIIIKDNGKLSSNFEMSLTKLSQNGHFGIMGMHQWISGAKGELSIAPKFDGMSINITVPILSE